MKKLSTFQISLLNARLRDVIISFIATWGTVISLSAHLRANVHSTLYRTNLLIDHLLLTDPRKEEGVIYNQSVDNAQFSFGCFQSVRLRVSRLRWLTLSLRAYELFPGRDSVRITE